MPKTVTIEVSDDLVPTLDKTVRYWRNRMGHSEEKTLLLIFRHGLDYMGYREPPGPDDNPFRAPRIDDKPDDGIPF